MKTDFSKLIPELSDWNNGKGIDARTWIQCLGSYQQTIGYSTIFWPEFAEVAGCIVHAGTSEELVLGCLKANSGNRRATESVANHIHLAWLHSSDKDVSAERVAYIGRVLKEVYECKLKRDFPDREMVVELDEPDADGDLVDYILSFHQAEKEKRELM